MTDLPHRTKYCRDCTHALPVMLGAGPVYLDDGIWAYNCKKLDEIVKVEPDLIRGPLKYDLGTVRLPAVPHDLAGTCDVHRRNLGDCGGAGLHWMGRLTSQEREDEAIKEAIRDRRMSDGWPTTSQIILARAKLDAQNGAELNRQKMPPGWNEPAITHDSIIITLWHRFLSYLLKVL